MTIGGTQATDSQGMQRATLALPEQMVAAAERAQGLSGLPSIDDVNSVVILGMGGSGIAGDIVAAAAGPFMPVPVVVAKSYELPAFVGEGSLVFAVSFSGETEETVEATTEAAVQGAKVVVVSGGGELTRLAKAWGAPLVTVPDDIPQPRAAVGADDETARNVVRSGFKPDFITVDHESRGYVPGRNPLLAGERGLPHDWSFLAQFTVRCFKNQITIAIKPHLPGASNFQPYF